MGEAERREQRHASFHLSEPDLCTEIQAALAAKAGNGSGIGIACSEGQIVIDGIDAEQVEIIILLRKGEIARPMTLEAALGFLTDGEARATA